MGNYVGRFLLKPVMQLIDPVPLEDVAMVDSALKHMFPQTHVWIPTADRQELARKRLCTRKSLSMFADGEGPFSALEYLRPETRAMLCRGSSVCSARDAIEQPMAPLANKPRLLDAPPIDEASMVYTIQQRHPWPDFKQKAQKFCDMINDEPEVKVSDLPSMKPIRFPLNKRAVYAACAEQFLFLSSLASDSIACSIEGAGGSQSFSPADFVVLDLSAVDQSQAEAAYVTAVVKVKSIMDLPVEPGDTWESISRDEDKLARVEQALQEAFALAVEEGVAFAAATSYMVTFFIVRTNVSDKHIYVSDPVWSHETGPSARACWYTFMAMAQDRRSVRAYFAREQVPFTGPGSRLALACTKTEGPPWKWVFQPPLRNADPTQLDGKGLSYSIPFADLHERAVFQTYSYAKVKEGETLGVRTIIKTFDRGDKDAVEAYDAERKAYNNLKDLQGVHIPRLLFWGPLQDTSNPTLVLEHCGTPLDSFEELTNPQRDAARSALNALHQKNYVHGNLSLCDLVWNAAQGRVVLIDLAEAYYLSKHKKDSRRESAILEGLLNEGPAGSRPF